MRLIGTLANENQARRFSSYLTQQGILNTCEVQFEAQSGHLSYPIWVHDEDQITAALQWFEQFRGNPSSSVFDVPVTKLPEEPAERIEGKPLALYNNSARLSYFFIALCALIFFLNGVQRTVGRTPLEMLLFYDIPAPMEEAQTWIAAHSIHSISQIEQLPADLQAQLQTIQEKPFFRGIYDWVVFTMRTGDGSPALGPLFIKKREGELWRLFTPCLLHGDIFHILFNMIWLWILGRSIEQRIGFFRMLFLTLILGVGSNTAQYFMGGPFFLGYSGIIMGLAGFIWSREKIAPWEGYPLRRSTLFFLAFYVLAILAIQVISFFLTLFTSFPFAPPIANTAHITGALLGVGLGKLSLFSWRAVR